MVGYSVTPMFSNGDDFIRGFPGLFAYWSAENTVLNAAGTTFVSLPDISLNQKAARNLVAVSTVPTWIQNDPNFGGRPSISATAANVRLQCVFDTSLSPPYTVYHVIRVVTNASTTMFWRTNAGNYTGSAGFNLTSSNIPAMLVHDLGNAVTAGSALANGNYVACFVYNAASSGMYFNNSQTANASGTVDSDPCTEMTIGNFTNAATYSWTACAMMAGAHDAPTRQQIMGFFGNKYGIVTT